MDQIQNKPPHIAKLINLFMLKNRSLHCTRVTIHKHLFASFIINNSLWLVWYRTVVNSGITVNELNQVSLKNWSIDALQNIDPKKNDASQKYFIINPIQKKTRKAERTNINVDFTILRKTIPY